MATNDSTLAERMERVLPNVLPLNLRLDPIIELTEDQFVHFCEMNEIVRIERSADGLLELSPLLVGDGGARTIQVIMALGMWERTDETGVAVTNAGFILPNTAMRAPTAAWVTKSRLARLTIEDKRGFFPLCPDFVIEMRWITDGLTVLQAKIEEYMANGARLGWLLDPLQRQAHIYRPNAEPEILDNPESISADPELPGFTLNLNPIWEPVF
ncbi:MAG: Uma2 family endonuclease [Chloroflexi bacterium]|nr:Uma2 family endonuclease [Chloroflexota bacterium]